MSHTFTVVCQIPSHLCFFWIPVVQLQTAVTSLIIVRIAQSMACFKALDLLFKRLLSNLIFNSVSIYGRQCKQITVISFWVLVTEALFQIFTSSAIILCERAREKQGEQYCLKEQCSSDLLFHCLPKLNWSQHLCFGGKHSALNFLTHKKVMRQ